MGVAILGICAILAACGAEQAPEREVDALARRRLALGLEDGPLDFKQAMGQLEERGYERLLKEAAVGRRPLGEVRDTALRIANLLDRAVPGVAGFLGGAGNRDVDVDMEREFHALFADALVQANAAASAAVAGQGDLARRRCRTLLESCVRCHQLYRE